MKNKLIYLSLKILDEDVTSFSLMWLLFLQCFDSHKCWIPTSFNTFGERKWFVVVDRRHRESHN